MKRNLRHDERPTLTVGLLFSVAAHLILLAALLWLHVGPSTPPSEAPSMLVSVVDSPEAPGPPEPPGPPAPTAGVETASALAAPIQQTVEPIPQAVEPTPQITTPEPTAPPEPDVEPVEVEVVAAAAVPNTSDLLSESQLAGAVGADAEAGGGGGGGGGGGCNTAQILQRALQRDPTMLRAVAEAGRAGKAVMLWNGAWVRSGDQEGKGLSGVRQAIAWELAFAPEACRNKRVKGLVLLSLTDGTRFAIGADDWRWSDLLEVPVER